MPKAFHAKSRSSSKKGESSKYVYIYSFAEAKKYGVPIDGYVGTWIDPSTKLIVGFLQGQTFTSDSRIHSPLNRYEAFVTPASEDEESYEVRIYAIDDDLANLIAKKYFAEGTFFELQRTETARKTIF